MKPFVACVIPVLILALASAPWMAPADDTIPTATPASKAPIRLVDCRIKPAEQVTLSANQAGAITSVPQEGEVVEEGARIIQLDDELAQASLAVAEKQAQNDVDIRFADKSSAVARLEYEQVLEVNSTLKGGFPVTEVRRRKLEYDRSLLQIDQSKHQQEIAILKRHEAAAQLRTFSVSAPFTGTVTRVLKRKGEAARPGEPVLDLVDTSRVRVEGFIPVAYRRRISPGTPVQVECELATGDETAPPSVGEIVFVDTVVQPVTRQIRVWADVDNSNGALVAGLTAVMTIIPDATSAENDIPTKSRK